MYFLHKWFYVRDPWWCKRFNSLPGIVSGSTFYSNLILKLINSKLNVACKANGKIYVLFKSPVKILNDRPLQRYCGTALLQGKMTYASSLVKYDITSIVSFSSINYLPTKIFDNVYQFAQQENSTAVTVKGNKHFLISWWGGYNFCLNLEAQEKKKWWKVDHKKIRRSMDICSLFLWKTLVVMYILNLRIKEKIARPFKFLNFKSVFLSIWQMQHRIKDFLESDISKMFTYLWNINLINGFTTFIRGR